MYFFVDFKKKTFYFFRKRVYADFLLTNCFNNHFQTHIFVVKNPISVLMEEKCVIFWRQDVLCLKWCFSNDVLLQDFESLKRLESRRNCALQDSSRFSLRYLCVRKKKSSTSSLCLTTFHRLTRVGMKENAKISWVSAQYKYNKRLRIISWQLT